MPKKPAYDKPLPPPPPVISDDEASDVDVDVDADADELRTHIREMGMSLFKRGSGTEEEGIGSPVGRSAMGPVVVVSAVVVDGSAMVGFWGRLSSLR